MVSVSCKALTASRSVAVIGAGAAGLTSARELLREGHRVVVFEQGPVIGGTWVYDAQTTSDSSGHDADRISVHSSMYRSLRTNLPREIMSFSDLPFTPAAMALVAAGARCTDSCQSTTQPVAANITRNPTDHADMTCNTFTGPVTSVDDRRYPGHEEVLRYLHAYALYHCLMPHVQLNAHVVSATPVTRTTATASSFDSIPSVGANIAGEASEGAAKTAATSVGTEETVDGMRWRLETVSPWEQNGNDVGVVQKPGRLRTWEFDALVVANGHYTVPSLPEIPGMSQCPVPQIHSHFYREPDPYKDMVVMVVGAANSGDDISRELSAVARHVLLSARTWRLDDVALDRKPYGDHNNILRYPMPLELTQDGYAIFPLDSASPLAHAGKHSDPPAPSGSSDRVKIDAIIYATGYKYSFPFLQCADQEASIRVESAERCVVPLYQHVFPANSLAPWLSFIGLCWKVIPFPQCELQARWVATVLSGRATLPPSDVMASDVAAYFNELDKTGTHIRYAHVQHLSQFEYNARLSEWCGCAPLPSWREEMYRASGDLRRVQSAHYRDATWDHMQTTLTAMEADVSAQIQRMREQLPQPVSTQA